MSDGRRSLFWHGASAAAPVRRQRAKTRGEWVRSSNRRLCTLLFHFGGGDVWRNRLPRSCPGLRPHSRFLYEPRGGRLCHLDTVYLLYDDGFGFRRGVGCSLGNFDYLTEEQAATLKNMR